VGDPERDPRTGELTGIFRVSFDLDLPELRSRRSLDGLRSMLATAARYGVTTAFDVQVPLEDLGSYELLQSRGELPIHVRVAIYHPPGTPPEQYAEFRLASERCAGERLQAGAVKLYIDGVQETHSAYLLEPYADEPPRRGETVYPESGFREVVATLDSLGFQILTHACGDAGVRAVLDAYEALGPSTDAPPRRHRIEHCENVAPDDLARFARLGVVPCMMPHHSSPDLTRRWRQTMGEARWRSAFPWKELLAGGARLAFSSDWPVADLNPFVHLRSAVARKDSDGNPSPHRLSVREAIDAYTQGAAYASGCDQDRGTLVAGKWCDLVVLSENPFETPELELDSVRVVATLVEGRIAYADSAMPGLSELLPSRKDGP
jgi:predicted amidohydrolase YtcJ